jgi:CRP/FNR family transcriptional regulator, anaerobic regulatory protein
MSFELILQHVAKHISLTEEEQLFFTSLLQTRKLKRKQFLAQEGDVAKGPAFVTEGLLRIYSIDKNGFEHVIQFAPAGWWAGDVQSMLTQQPGNLYIDALEDSEILWFWKSDLDKLYATVPKFERFFRILAENAIASFQNRLVNMLSLPAAERYNTFCKLYPSLIQSLPQKQVASYIGVTPEFLSKMLGNLKQ